ncbi:hypothetical protein CJF42_03320 [Pseudoalteromonas sp. NBT06-2]|uniref:relaxase/mobilization nuclease domain-containing protein n=1 Tax=Pseudoalteromonas sp. NBT06-2 TaxID=2025950 RepID=UPI000BA6F26D|nr:hypothetical protein [Pseudoalteromonas sp. NBT06-2]PAJ75761.1 hypothetical protein CJF42_03320 [Pseudoalteromonas sp. NBT06-2]
MATANPKASRPDAGPTVIYVYRGDGHEHPVDADNVIHLGGNILSNPLKINEDGSKHFELDEVINEMEMWGRLNKTAEKKFKHYVLSIAPEDTGKVNVSDWMTLINEYMTAVGYGPDTKWTSALHNDTTLGHASNETNKDGGQHAHIISCLVQPSKGNQLVKTSLDYEKGWPVMRAFELRHNLRIVATPGSENDFGYNFTKAQMKGHGSRQACLDNDWGAIIRARIKNLYESDGKPKTIKDFALGLAKRNVSLQAVKNKDGSIRGVNYQVLGFKKGGKKMDSPMISGSKIKGTRFSWPKLIHKEKMNYNPSRDDKYIGLAPVPQRMTASFKVNKSQLRSIKMLGSRARTKPIAKGFVNLSFCRTKEQKTIALMMMAVMDLLEVLFARREIEFFEYTLHEYKEQTTEYDLFSEPLDIVNQIESDTQCNVWKHLTDDGGSGGTDIDLS